MTLLQHRPNKERGIDQPRGDFGLHAAASVLTANTLEDDATSSPTTIADETNFFIGNLSRLLIEASPAYRSDVTSRLESVKNRPTFKLVSDEIFLPHAAKP